ncbi:MAG: asparagine synthetase B, partial [Chloroflexi bacterium]|nr:asparagine synthetase B [Chloroflexota bacterium]
CARDHMGVKPLYYYYQPGRIFAFASEIKALLQIPSIPRCLNEIRVGDYLAPLLEDKAITFYQDILRLPPGHSMTIRQEGCQLQTYWQLDPTRELRLGSDEEYAEAYREILTEAVRCRLRSAFPVGSMLSGGLDSSSVTCIAQRLLAQEGKQPLHTFSAVFEEVPESDESAFIQAVLAQASVHPHFIHGDRLSPLADLDRVFWHEDEAFYAFNLFLSWETWKVAQEQGVRILLDGFVGDSTVPDGLTFLIELSARGKWIALAREIRALARRYHTPSWGPFRHYLWNHGIKPRILSPLRRIWQREEEIEWNETIRPAFARRIGLKDRIRALQAPWLKPLKSMKAYHYHGLTSGEIPFALEVYNKGAAAFPIEVRFPFTDRRLIEFALSLPPEQMLRAGWTRAIVRHALGGILPEKVRWRRGKGNLGPNFERALLKFERKRLDDVILRDSRTIEPFVNIAALRETYKRYIDRRAGDEVLPIWLATTLALWLRSAEIES